MNLYVKVFKSYRLTDIRTDIKTIFRSMATTLSVIRL